MLLKPHHIRALLSCCHSDETPLYLEKPYTGSMYDDCSEAPSTCGNCESVLHCRMSTLHSEFRTEQFVIVEPNFEYGHCLLCPMVMLEATLRESCSFRASHWLANGAMQGLGRQQL